MRAITGVMSLSISRMLPITEWLPHYDRAWLRSDVLAGVTVWAFAVPQSMAYAHIAGLPPQAGIFVSFAAPLGYALFGTSRQLVCGPSSSTAAISAAHIAPLVASHPAEFAAMSAMLALVCGVILLVMGLLRLGFISQFIATSVQIGFAFGLGMTILAGQLFTLFGIAGVGGPFYRQLLHFVTHLDQANGWTLALGAASLVAILTLRRLAPAIPAALVVVAVSIVVTWRFGLTNHGVATIGEIDRLLPFPALPLVSPDTLPALIPAAAAIIMVSYSESTTIARTYASEHHYEIRPNQELIALGVSGIASGLFQGFVTSGGASQSVENNRAGAKTQVSSMVLAALAVFTAAALLPLIANLPLAVLGAIVIVTVMGLINVPAMQRMWRIRRQGFALALVALISVLLLGIATGLIIAVFLSLLQLLVQLSRPRAELVPMPEAAPAAGDQLLGIRPDGPLLFINAAWVRDRLKARIADAKTSPRVVVLDLDETTTLDFTSFATIASLRQELAGENMTLWLTNVHAGVRAILDRDSVTRDPPPWIFASNEDALAALQHLTTMPRDPPGRPGQQATRDSGARPS